MATNDIPCQHNVIPPCTDSSYSLCPHCSLKLCLEHINEHQQLVRIQFNEIIDRINEQKSMSNTHLVVDEMRTKALAELDTWKTAKTEAVMAIYTAEHIRIENACEKCISDKSIVQNLIFEEMNTASNVLDKKKNIHPLDMKLLEQKINELNAAIKRIEQNTNTDLTTIVAQTKLPETIELEQRLKEAQESTEGHQKKINAMDDTIRKKDQTLRRLQQTIAEKDEKIENLKAKLQRYK